MIYTRFGSEVNIIAGNNDTGEVEIKHSDGDIDHVLILELRADGGIMEIIQEIDKISHDNKHNKEDQK